MHDTLRLSDPEARERAAGEYVLRTLTRRQQAEFEALLAVSPSCSRASTPGASGCRRECAAGPVDPPGHTVATDRRPGRAGRRWWRRLGLWQGISALSTLAALLRRHVIAAPTPPMMDSDYVFVANARVAARVVGQRLRQRREMRIQTLAPGPMPAGMACELWMMDNGKPVSLGMLPSSGQKSMRLPERCAPSCAAPTSRSAWSRAAALRRASPAAPCSIMGSWYRCAASRSRSRFCTFRKEPRHRGVSPRPGTPRHPPRSRCR